MTKTSKTRSSLSFLTPIDRIRVSASDDRLVEVKLGAPDLPDSRGTSTADDICQTARKEIEAFLRAELERFTVPYRLIGTPFQRSVWKEMVRIPLGSTATYGQLARRLDDPGASRAVGVACGANPIPIIVPCHRVVASNGLGGFSGGLERKKWLLKLEFTRRVPSVPAAAAPAPSDTAGVGEQQSLF